MCVSRVNAMDDLQKKLYSYIVGNIEKEIFQDLEAQILIKYGVTENFLEENLLLSPKPRLRSQMRRYLIDEAFTAVNGQINYTIPKGEHYVSIETNNIILTHIEVNSSGAKVRDAAHRKLLSMGNKALEPLQLDFFDSKQLELEQKLHIVVMIVHPKIKDEQQSSPQEIFVAVPFSNWKDYHALLHFNELLEMYNSEEMYESDLAWPTLKVALEQFENKTSNGE